MLLCGILSQLPKVVTCSQMHLFLASLPPESHLSPSPIGTKQTICTLLLGNWCQHSKAWAECILRRGDSISKGTEVCRSMLYWGWERSLVWLQSRPRKTKSCAWRFMNTWLLSVEERLWVLNGIFKKSFRWFSGGQEHSLWNREKENLPVLLPGTFSQGSELQALGLRSVLPGWASCLPVELVAPTARPVAWAAAAVAGGGQSSVNSPHTLLLPGLGQLPLPSGCTDRNFLSAAAPYHSPFACLHSQGGAHWRLPFQKVIDILIQLAPVNGRIKRHLQRRLGKDQVLFIFCLDTEMCCYYVEQVFISRLVPCFFIRLSFDSFLFSFFL